MVCELHMTMEHWRNGGRWRWNGPVICISETRNSCTNTVGKSKSERDVRYHYCRLYEWTQVMGMGSGWTWLRIVFSHLLINTLTFEFSFQIIVYSFCFAPEVQDLLTRFI